MSLRSALFLFLGLGLLGQAPPDPTALGALDFLDLDPGPRYLEAVDAFNRKEFKRSAALLLLVLQRRSSDPQALLLLGMCYAQMKDAPRAARCVQAALDLGLPTPQWVEHHAAFAPVREAGAFQGARQAARAWTQARGEALFLEVPSILACRVHLPEGYDPKVPVPLLVGLHGRGSNAELMASIWTLFPKPPFIYVALEAPFVSTPTPNTPTLQRHWDIPGATRSLYQRVDPVLHRGILEAIHQLQARFSIQGVYLLGHSQGASMAYLVGLQEPERIQGILAFGGVLPTDFLPEGALGKGRVPVFIAHGRRDPVVALAEGERARKILEDSGHPVTWVPFEGGHEMGAEALKRAVAWVRGISPAPPSRSP